MNDKFAGRPEISMMQPITDGVAVTPHDTNDLAQTSRALWVGGAGNIKLITAEGNTLTLSGITAGTLIPIRCSRVFSTDTTATLIVNLY